MRKFIYSLMALVLASCSIDQNNVDREKIRQEMNDREIKKLSDADIQEAAYNLGEQIVAGAQQVVLDKLNPMYSKASKDSTAGSGWVILPPCSAFNDYLLRDFNDSIHHDVTLVSDYQFDLTGDIAEKSRRLLEAYAYNDENGLPLESNVQKLEPDFILFTKPITKNELSCTPCMREINDNDTINIPIPADSVGFCGMWLVKITKKELIKSI